MAGWYWVLVTNKLIECQSNAILCGCLSMSFILGWAAIVVWCPAKHCRYTQGNEFTTWCDQSKYEAWLAPRLNCWWPGTNLSGPCCMHTNKGSLSNVIQVDPNSYPFPTNLLDTIVTLSTICCHARMRHKTTIFVSLPWFSPRLPWNCQVRTCIYALNGAEHVTLCIICTNLLSLNKSHQSINQSINQSSLVVATIIWS